MADTDFLLRIVLRARNEMGGTLARARAELAAFTDEGERLERRTDTLNRRLETLNKRMDTFARRGDSIKQSLGIANTAADDFEDRVRKSVASQREEEAETRLVSEALEARAKVERQLSTLAEERNRVTNELAKTQAQLARHRFESARAADEEAAAENKNADAIRRATTARVEAAQAEADAKERINRLNREGANAPDPENDPEAQARLERARVQRRTAREADIRQSAEQRAQARRDAREEQNELQRQQAAVLAAAQAAKEAENEKIAAERDAARTRTRGPLTDTERIREEAAARRENKKAIDEETGAIEKNSEEKSKNVTVLEKAAEAAADSADKERSLTRELSLNRREQEQLRRQREEESNRELQDLMGIGGGAGGNAPDADRRQKERFAANVAAVDKLQERYNALFDDLEKFRNQLNNEETDIGRVTTKLRDFSKAFNDLKNSRKGLTEFEPGRQFSQSVLGVRRSIDEDINRLKKPDVVDDDSINKTQELDAHIKSLRDDYNDFVQSVRRGNVDLVRQHATFRVFSDDFKRAANAARGDRDRQIELTAASQQSANAASNLGRRISALGRATDDVRGKQGGLLGRIEQATAAMTRQGESVAALDNKLRGLVVLAVMTFAQQLITVMGVLAGALSAVGSSAVYAAGAVGGALVAGIAQALPAIGLIIAALARLKGIMDTVNQANLVQQQLFERQDNNQKKAADSSDALANAQDGVKSAMQGVKDAQEGVTEALRNQVQANDRVAEAQKELTRTRRDARFELRDLIQAERDATLAARGAAITQAEAQQRLRETVASGDIGNLPGAELGVLEADQGAARARNDLADARRARRRVGGNIENLDDVKSAVKQLEDAKQSAHDAARSVDKAREAVDKARDSVDKAQRSLAKTERTAATVADDQFSGLEKLMFLLKNMTGAQVHLFAAIQMLKAVWEQNLGPILDIIVESFADVVDRTVHVLQDPRILGAARGMATGIANAIRRITGEFTSYSFLGQIAQITNEGTRNIPTLTRIVVALGKAFANIAQAAGPALSTILDDLASVAEDILGITENSDGMATFFNAGVDQLEAWGRLAKQVILLFADFVGIAAPEGLGMLDSATKFVEDLRTRMDNSSGDVLHFIQESRKGLGILFHLIGEIVKGLASVFDVDRMQPLAQFIEQALIPGLVHAIVLVSELATLFFKLVEFVPGGTQTVGLLIFFASLASVVAATRSLIVKLGIELLHAVGIGAGLVGTLSTLLRKIPGVGNRLGDIFGKAGSRADTVKNTAGELADDAGSLIGKDGKLASTAEKEGETVGKSLGRGVSTGFRAFLKGTGILALAGGLFITIKDLVKFGDLTSATRDIGHFLSFGIIDSAEEVAKRNAGKISDAITDAVDERIRTHKLPSFQPNQLRVPTVAQTGPRPSVVGTRDPVTGGIITAGDFARMTSDFTKWVESLPKKLREPAVRAAELADQLQALGNSKSIASFQKIRDEASKLGGQFPELADAFDKIASSAEDSAKRIYDAFAPERISVRLGQALQVDPKHWKDIVDDAMKEMSKLPPGMQGKARESILHMVDELQKRKLLPAKVAAQVKDSVVDQAEKMRKRTVEKSANLVTQTNKNFVAWANSVSISMGWLGDQVNDSLKALGLGAIRALTNKKAANQAGQLAGNLATLAGSLFGAATGYYPGGYGHRGKDSLLARIAPGEAVLPWFVQRAVDAQLPGQQTIYNIAKQINGTHGGTIGESKGGFASGIVPVPGYMTSGTPEEIARSILPLVERLWRRYHFTITDAFDRDRSAGHQSPGHNITGTAVDFVPGRGGSWDTIENLGRWAVSKGLTVYYGTHGVGTPLAGHGRGNHMHIEFGKAVGQALRVAMDKIKSPQISGTEGALKDLANASLRRVTRLANSFLERKAQDAASSDVSFAGIGGGGTNRQNIALGRRMASRYGWTGSEFAALVRLWTGESGWNQFADNPSSDAYGIPQALPGSKMAAAGADWRTNPKTQIEWGLKYIKDRYGDPIAALNAWMARSPHWYAAGGSVPGQGPVPAVLHGGEHVFTAGEVAKLGGHQVLYALRRLLGGGGQGGPFGYQAGGQVLQIGDSLSVGIQDFLRKMVRGLVSDTRVGRASDEAFRVLKRKLTESYKAVIFDVGTNDAQASVLHRNLKKAYRLLGNDQELFLSTARGPNARANNQVIREFASTHDRVNLVKFKPDQGDVAGDGIHLTASGYRDRARVFAKAIKEELSRPGAPTTVNEAIGGLGGTSIKRSEARINASFTTAFEKIRRENIRSGLYDLPTVALRSWDALRKEVKRAFKAINEAGGKMADRLQKINNEIDRIREDETPSAGQRIRLTDLRRQRNRITSNPRFQAFRAASRIDTTTQLVNEGGLLDQMDAQRERMSRAAQRSIQLLGIKFKRVGDKIRNVRGRDNDVEVAERTVEEARKNLDRITGERGVIAEALKKITQRLKKLQKGGVSAAEAPEVKQLSILQTGLQDRLQDIDDAQAQAIQDLLQAKFDKQQAIVDKITHKADRQLANADIWARIVSAMGDTGALQAINKKRADIMTQEANDLEKRIDDARRIGDTDLAEQLEAQVADLRASVFEMAQQAVQDAMTSIENSAQRRLGRLDLFGRLADALGKVGLSGAVSLGGESLTRGQVFAQRGQTLTDERSQLQQLLAATIANPQTRANTQAIQDLTDKILELDVSIQENTAAAFQARVDEVNSRFSYILGINDLNRQIISLTGEIANNTDTAGLLRLAQERATILEGQRAEIQGLLLDAIAAGNEEQVHSLTEALLNNQIALLENTKTINELNGTIQEPQQWSTTMWQTFRQAIFDGTGNILPQYALPVQLTSGSSVSAARAASVMPVVASTSTSNADKTFVWNNNYNEVNEAPSPMEVVNRADWQFRNETTLQ